MRERLPPASGSGLSLSIPSWHATPYDPGEFDDGKFQGSNVDGAFGAKPTSRHSHYSAIRFTRGINFGASTVHTFAAACQVARPPERI